MSDPDTSGIDDTEKKALDGISVAPPAPADEPETAGDAESPAIREAADAESNDALKRDPSDADAKLDIGLDETFPSSDAPANTRPGSGEPAPSSGYDEAAERERAGS